MKRKMEEKTVRKIAVCPYVVVRLEFKFLYKKTNFPSRNLIYSLFFPLFLSLESQLRIREREFYRTNYYLKETLNQITMKENNEEEEGINQTPDPILEEISANLLRHMYSGTTKIHHSNNFPIFFIFNLY